VARWELEQARLAIVACVRALALTDPESLPLVLRDAWQPLAELEARVREHDAAQREKHRLIEMHYLARAGDRKTLCGLKADDVPHGWVGAGNEFLNRRLRAEGAVCPTCLERS